MKSTPSCMNEVVWPDRPHEVLTNGHPEMSGVQSVRHIATRSQDDAMVGYFFQRPQTDPDFQNYAKQSRWALGDDSVLEVRGSDNSELESDFQALALETGHPSLEYSPAAKKLWGVEDTKQDESKGILFGDQWRDAAWSTGHNSASDTGGLGVKMVEYVLGSSPTSKDLDNRMARMHHLGMNSSDNPEKLKKLKSISFDGELKGKEQEGSGVIHQSNGILQNGLSDDSGYHHSNSRQSSPSEDIGSKKHILNEKMPKHSEQMMPQSSGANMQSGGTSLGGLDQGFEGVSMDQLQFDYSSAFMPNMDSPNMDYTNQMTSRKMVLNRGDEKFGSNFSCQDPQHFFMELYSRAQGQPMPVMGQQQFPMQQQGQMQAANPAASPAPFASSPYVMNQDPYAAAASMGTIMPGPMMTQYYGVPPWGMFPTPAGMVQGGQGQTPNTQQQLMRGGGARPMTPQGPGADTMTQGGGGMPQSMQGPGGQYQMVAPSYYENGSVMMGNARGMGTAMRLMPPVIVNPAAASNSTPGTMGSGGLRLLGSQAQQNPAASLFNSGTPNSNTIYSSPANSNMTFNHPTSGLGFSGTNGSQLGYGSGLGLGPAQPQSTMGYGSNSMGPIGASLSAIGTSIGGTAGSPRRDSFDRRDGTSLGTMAGSGFSGGLESQLSRQMTQQKGNQFYGPLGSVTASGPGPIGMMPPSQSLTPPPQSLNGGSLGNLNLGTLGGRILSAAPGAEAKYMIRNGPLGNNVFNSSNTLFPNRTLQRSSSLEKPSGRSRLLEDFRNNRYPNLQLRDLSNHIVEFSQDQHGSRFIQQKLERATPSEKQLVFTEILGAAYSLMTDVFGNYVIQKFFEFGTQEQKQALAQKVKGHVLPLALQMYGCRVIQKALESIPPEQQEIVKELDGHVLKCVKDQNGNHVVQKCIECVDPIALQFIINAFQGQVYTLSTHPYGCRVIQRILEHCTPEQTSPVLEELHQHTEQLVQDQYGNYVVQHVLEHGCQEDKSKIVNVVRGKVLSLSQHKFASNVVEKCVTHATRSERGYLIEEVCTFNDGPHSALYAMMKDQYANYVVQRMIEVSEPPQRKLLLHKIRPHITSLRKYTYGKHILAKLEKYLMKNNELGPIGAPSNGNI
ncbi:pumilio homolog 2 isoform X2 [Parasteatoda tepidariorum]|uniref:pumilio homolog 2 isoform X2 n=2 Tax=Parasteatoda tepidariorum TaxID=114398 RepID=UPI00077FA14F|nr:pumilio homolog 2 isoform X2 [Parasteatoda tepidariorum]